MNNEKYRDKNIIDNRPDADGVHGVENMDDERIRMLIRDGLPPAPRNPWFVRKVLNKLPDRTPRNYTWIDWLSYTISIGVLLGMWYLYSGSVGSGVLTLFDVVFYAIFGVMALIVALCIMGPAIHAWLRPD